VSDAEARAIFDAMSRLRRESTPGPIQPADPAEAADPFGGHEFAYESSTDLFRCTHCRAYEVTVRGDDGKIAQCPGDVPGEPMVLNAW